MTENAQAVLRAARLPSLPDNYRWLLVHSEPSWGELTDSWRLRIEKKVTKGIFNKRQVWQAVNSEYVGRTLSSSFIGYQGDILYGKVIGFGV